MEYIENTIRYLDKNFIQVILSIFILVFYFVSRSIARRLVRNHAAKKEMAYTREVYVSKLIGAIIKILFGTLIGMIWEISLRGLSIYFASVFTVIGVGLFATWSILSNLTASVILFFFFPYRIGERIKIMDGDNSVEGQVVDITLFYLRIRTESGEVFSYPNNLAIQKPIRQSKESIASDNVE